MLMNGNNLYMFSGIFSQFLENPYYMYLKQQSFLYIHAKPLPMTAGRLHKVMTDRKTRNSCLRPAKPLLLLFLVLTLSQTINFRLFQSISPFSTVLSKELYYRHVKTRASLGKG